MQQSKLQRPSAFRNKSSSVATEESFQQGFRVLRDAIQSIYAKSASMLSFEELYRAAYNLVIRKQGDKLYDGVRETLTCVLEAWVKEHLRPFFPPPSLLVLNAANESVSMSTPFMLQDPPARSSREEERTGNLMAVELIQLFLGKISQVWQDHLVALAMICDVLLYLDRNYVKARYLASVYDLGLGLFLDKVLVPPPPSIATKSEGGEEEVYVVVVKSVLKLIHLERLGNAVDSALLNGALRMFATLSTIPGAHLVKDVIEQISENTHHFYHHQSSLWIHKLTVADYLAEVQERLKEESQRNKRYLAVLDLEAELETMVVDECLEAHLTQIIELRYPDVERMYRLLKKTKDGHAKMQAVFVAYIRGLGHAVNANAVNSAAQWVDAVLELKAKVDKLQKEALCGDKQFQIKFDEAFAYFVNAVERAPELISLFVDEHLRRGLKGKSEEEGEGVLCSAIVLFKFIKDKDVFERYYKQHLAKRLLHARTLSDDAERSMLSKLKMECGLQFTSKLEGMFIDMKVSKEMSNEFHALDDLPMAHLLQVNVLTSTYWPSPTTMHQQQPVVTACQVSPELTLLMNRFEQFYLARHNGRRLAWQWNQGNADMRAHFGPKKYELNVTTMMMVVLLCFNEHQDDYISYAFLKEATDLPDVELCRTLQSLACGKHKVLVKEPKSKEVAKTDRFIINSSFTSPLHKVRIPLISLTSSSSAATGEVLESEQSLKDTREKVDQDRRYQIEAAIVRVMKTRRTLSHAELIAEVTRLLQPRFQVDPQMAKKRIEALIEREYLERSVENHSVYHYLA